MENKEVPQKMKKRKRLRQGFMREGTKRLPSLFRIFWTAMRAERIGYMMGILNPQ